MSARLADGWVQVEYDGPEPVVHLGVTLRTPAEADWRPAYRDWHDGLRVAKVRPAGARGHVWLRAAGEMTRAGRI